MGGRFALAATLLVCSGATSLTLEVVWSRSLRLHFGASALAQAAILVAYMLGLGAGALGGGAFARRCSDSLRAYGLLELGIGLYAFVSPGLFAAALPVVSALPIESAYVLTLLRFAVALLLLLPPTLAMGATLPILVDGFATRGRVGGRAGLLYGLNTVGAVAGVLLATFALLPALGLRGTTFATGAAALVVAALAIGIGFRLPSGRAAGAASIGSLLPGWNARLGIYAAIGFTALVYEVAWTRALQMVLGSSIYAFSTMLATFLAGIGLGSGLASRWVDRAGHPQLLWAGATAALAVAAIGTGLCIGVLPDLYLGLIETFGPQGGALVATQLCVAATAMLLPALLLGVMFPLAVRTLVPDDRSPGEAVGGIYFANTVGSAAGAVASALVLIPLLGLRETLGVAIAIDLCAAAALLPPVRRRRVAATVLVALAAAVLVRPPSWDPASLIRAVYWRTAASLSLGIDAERDPMSLLYYRDGLSATVSVELSGEQRTLRVNGKADASDGRSDMETQVLLAHLPLLFGPPASSALVIGLGSGVTATSASLHGLDVLDVAEIEPAVVDGARQFEHVHATPLEPVLDGLHLEDGRSWLSRADERYDVIISEPSNPWITGVSNLFTREFFREAHRALRPGGRLTQWLELYGLKPDQLASVLRSLSAEFRYVYGFVARELSSDVILVATDRALEVRDLPEWHGLSPAVARDLERVGIFSGPELWSLLRLAPEDVTELASSAPVANSDDNLFVELGAPWSLSVTYVGENWKRWQGTRGIASLAAGLGAEELGAVAESYARERRAFGLAQDLAARAGRRGARVWPILVEATVRAERSGVPQARPLFELAATLAPNQSVPHLARADVRLQTDDPAGALTDATTALRLRPGDPRARVLRMRALFALGRAREALADVRVLQASGEPRRHPELLLDLSAVAAEAGDGALAIELNRRYTRVDRDSDDAWARLAWLYAEAGDETLAAEARLESTRARHRRAHELRRRARVATWMGETDRALGLLEQAVTLDPGNRAARSELAHLRLVRR